MERENKSMNVDEEELEEGSAKKGEPLAKRYNYEGIPKQTSGTVEPDTSGSGGIRPGRSGMQRSIESTHGDQMKKGFSIGGTCGLCKRISKSITENVCDDCQSSMNTTQWHTSHLG